MKTAIIYAKVVLTESKGAWATIVEREGQEIADSGRMDGATEIQVALRAVTTAVVSLGREPHRVVLSIANEELVSTMKFPDKWARNNFKAKPDWILWRRLNNAMSQHKVTFIEKEVDFAGTYDKKIEEAKFEAELCQVSVEQHFAEW